MKKILLLALLFLPFFLKAQTVQTNPVFPLAAFTGGIQIGSHVISFNSSGGVLVDGNALTAAQQALVDAVVKNSSLGVTSNAVYITNQATITRLIARMDSLSTAITNLNKKIASDSVRAIIPSYGIDPASLTVNSIMNTWVDAKITRTYFSPPAISFGSPTANSIPVILTPVSGATSYQIWFSTDNITFSLLTTLSGGLTTYTHTGLTAGTTYYYKATATNGTNTSMPVTANASTLAAVNYTQQNYVNFANDEQFNGGGYYGNFQLFLENDDASQISKSNGIVTVISLEYLGVSFNGNAPDLQDGTYRMTFTGLNIAPTLTINTDGSDHLFSPTTFLNGIAVYDFVIGGSSRRNAMYLNFGSTPITITSIKLEKQN